MKIYFFQEMKSSGFDHRIENVAKNMSIRNSKSLCAQNTEKNAIIKIVSIADNGEYLYQSAPSTHCLSLGNFIIQTSSYFLKLGILDIVI